jgi:rRNA maturation endonuclease Nob1
MKEIKMKVFDKKQVEELFQITTMYITDCCGEYVSDDCSDICPACGEHTEIITEEYEVSR